MKIIAIEKELPGARAENFEQHSKAEAMRAWELYQSGIIRELYFRQDRHEAVLILECHDLAEAETVLKTLPLVKEKLIAFDLIPLVPYPGFARLFI
jgi:muconolactone delta-isomerase